MSPELLTVDEVAEIVHTDPSTVRKWIAAGKLEASRPGRMYLIRRESIDAMLEDTRVIPQPQSRPAAAPRPTPIRPRPGGGGSVRDRLRSDRKRAA